MLIEAYEGYPYEDVEEVYDITDVNLEDVISFLHRKNKNPSHYVIEYVHCGYHIVGLRKLSEEELDGYRN